MSFSTFLSQIRRSVWAISDKDVVGWLPQINNWLSGIVVAETPELKPLAAAVVSDTDFNTRRHSSFDDAAPGSTAVVSVVGPMMKYGDWCSYGTDELAAQISEAANHKNISSVIIQFDTGGGTTDSVVPLIDAINQCKQNGKPTIAFCHSALSAGYRVACECDMIIASNEMAEFGSIGVFVRFPDSREFYAEQGIKFVEVYAPESGDKNAPYLEALEGNVELLQSEVLSPYAKNFGAAVKAARPNLDISTDGILSGRVFYAKSDVHDCKKNGLIDKIGNLEFAAKEARRLSKSNRTTNKSINNQIHSTMNKNETPILASMLGHDLEANSEGQYTISADEVDVLMTTYTEKTKKPLQFRGVSFEEDGSLVLTESKVRQIEAHFSNMYYQASQNQQTPKFEDSDAYKQQLQRIAELEAQNAQLANEPEDVKLANKLNDAGKSAANAAVKFLVSQTGINTVDESHPWNQAAVAIAQGNRQMAQFYNMYGSSGLTITQLQDELGAFHMADEQTISDFLYPLDDLSTVFPWRSTGIKDELPSLALFVGEFLQPRNSEWAKKGSFEIQADTIKVKNWQVSHGYTAAEMWSFIESWIASKTKGTDPFQESLVQYFTNKMLEKIANEKRVNATRGVFLTPIAGEAGRAINAMDGLFVNLMRLIADFRILVHRIGKGDYQLVDTTGLPNQNHVYYKRQQLIKCIPADLRDAFNWNVYMSKEDIREYNRFLKEVVAVNPNYSDVEKAESYDNFTNIGLPHWTNGLIVITLPKNILQGYREKSDDNRLYFQKDKRDTNVFMDGGYVIAPVLSGYKYNSYAELVASGGERQRIFTNGEFGAFTAIPAIADDTTPSVLLHNVIETVDNTGATAITGFDDAVIGQFIHLIGGSNVNPATIAAAAANFKGVVSDITFNAGVTAKFLVTAVDEFTLVALFENGSEGAIMFDIDDKTPDVGGATLFITNPDNTAATAITDFEGAANGVPFKVLGGGGANASTIAKADKFSEINATWTGNEGEEIVLQRRNDGKFVETLI